MRMKNYGMTAALVISLTLGTAVFPLSAAAKQPAHEIRRVTRKTTDANVSSDKSTSKKKKKEKQAEVKKKKKTAKKYVGKKLTNLVKAVGKYKRLSKARSCYYMNEYDGIAKYDGFSVYCHTKGRKIWYVDAVE